MTRRNSRSYTQFEVEVTGGLFFFFVFLNFLFYFLSLLLILLPIWNNFLKKILFVCLFAWKKKSRCVENRWASADAKWMPPWTDWHGVNRRTFLAFSKLPDSLLRGKIRQTEKMWNKQQLPTEFNWYSTYWSRFGIQPRSVSFLNYSFISSMFSSWIFQWVRFFLFERD